MPQLQSLAIVDRAATPVTHTFLPRDIVNGVATVIESNGVPIGDNRIEVLLKKVGTRYKGEVRLSMPVVQTETINGVSRPTVVRTNYANVVVSFDERSTEQERTDCVGLIYSSLQTSKTLVHDTLVKLQSVY